jgi:hypothetical protein
MHHERESDSLESGSSLDLDSDHRTGAQTQTGAGTPGWDFDSSDNFSLRYGYDLQRDRDVETDNRDEVEEEDESKDGMSPFSRPKRKKRSFTRIIQENDGADVDDVLGWDGADRHDAPSRPQRTYGPASIATRSISSLEGIGPWANAHAEGRHDNSASAGSSHRQHPQHIRSRSRDDPGCHLL